MPERQVVLVVFDWDPDHVRRTRLKYGMVGYKVHLAYTTDYALTLIHDLHLKDVDILETTNKSELDTSEGLELLKNIKADDDHRDIFIFLSTQLANARTVHTISPRGSSSYNQYLCDPDGRDGTDPERKSFFAFLRELGWREGSVEDPKSLEPSSS